MTPEETKRLLEISHDVKAALPEVRRIVRENNQMRRWLRHGETTLDMYHTHIVDEMNAKMPDLFKTKRRGSK